MRKEPKEIHDIRSNNTSWVRDKEKEEILYLRGLSLVIIEVGRNGYNGVVNLLTQVAFSDLLHLSEYHGGDLLGSERSVLAINFHGDRGLLVAVGDLKRKMLNIGLDVLVGPFAANESPVDIYQQEAFAQRAHVFT